MKLDAGELDFAIIEGEFPKDEYEYLLYSQEEYVAAGNKKIAERFRGASIKDLFTERIILREPGSGTREILENEFGVPTAVENDVNAAALGEGYFGAAKGMSEYLCLTYGTGVGGAVVIDGKIFKGFAGSAGEFGSMIIHGEEVRQGVRISGCYEDYASTSALVRRVSKEAVQVANGREVFEHIDMPEVKRVVDDWIQEIAHGLVTLIHVFNPRSVIIGGGVMVQEYVAESVRTVVSERIMPSFRDVEISVASLGNKAGLWGAVYITEQKLKIPETTIL